MSGLAAHGISVTLGRRRLLTAAALAAPRGRVTGLIGPNGAGKTTLLRAIAGLVPATGTLSLDGAPLPPPGTRGRARRLGYLPQGHEVHWPLTVQRTVELGRLPHRDPLRRGGAHDAAVVAEVMRRTDIDHFASRPVSTLSGGERARVMLARALAADTPVLLADEPVAALDPGHQLRVMDLLGAEARDRNRAVVVVLHDLSLAARYCDHLVLMTGGAVLSAGPADAVLAAGTLRRAYGVPFAIAETAGTPTVVPLTAA